MEPQIDYQPHHEPNGTSKLEHAIATSPPPATALVRRSPLEEIRELVTYLQDLRQVCEALCKATVLPPYMQNPANLQLVLMQGLSMGFTVPQAIRASFVIPPKSEHEVARVGYYVDSLVALVRKSDRCRFFRIEETTAKKHRVVCARTDEPETVVHVFELSREEAAASGMDKKRWRDRGGEWREEVKYQWLSMPADMLNARNCGRAVKRVFQDVVFGMSTQEELEEIIVADRADHEVFAAIPRAAHAAKRVEIIPSAPTSQDNVAIPVVREASEPHVVPAGDVSDPMRSDVAPTVVEGSGDPAWDGMLAELGRHFGVDMTGWLPSDVLEEWQRRLGAADSKGKLTLLAPAMPIAAARMSESKSCSDVFAKMRASFAERDREIKAAERAARTAEAGAK